MARVQTASRRGTDRDIAETARDQNGRRGGRERERGISSTSLFHEAALCEHPETQPLGITLRGLHGLAVTAIRRALSPRHSVLD